MIMNNDKTTIVIDTTGLVGSEVLDQLLGNNRYSKVKVFHRRRTDISHSELEEHIVAFKKLDS